MIRASADAGGTVDHAELVDPFDEFDGFVIAHATSLVRCAYLIVGDVGAAQDVVQIALAKVARRWPTVVARGDPLPYARTAVVHAAISWRRRKWHGEVPGGTLPEQAATDATGVVDDHDRLRRALAHLPRRQRAAVVLRHYLDLDESATAAVLGCSVGTVKSQTSKGLTRLRVAVDGATESTS
jgi:RNA polymerase sigma-70 factor (sigma-E family)